MRTANVERDIANLTNSVKGLNDSVQKLVITLDRGKWLGYGVLIMIAIQTLGLKEVLRGLLG